MNLLKRIKHRVARSLRRTLIRGNEAYREEILSHFRTLVAEGPGSDIVEQTKVSFRKLPSEVQGSANLEAIQNYLAIDRKSWVPKLYAHPKLKKYPSVEYFVGDWWYTADGLELSRRMILKGLRDESLKNLREFVALDIGCGGGRLMKEFSSDFKQIHGVDISSEMIEFAQEYLSENGVENAYPALGDGFTLELYPDDAFDFVYSIIMFDHIKTLSVIEVYCAEIFRVLKPGGRVLIQTAWFPDGVKLPSSFELTTNVLESNQSMLIRFAQGLGLGPGGVRCLLTRSGLIDMRTMITERPEHQWKVGDPDLAELSAVVPPSNPSDTRFVWTYGRKGGGES